MAGPAQGRIQLTTVTSLLTTVTIVPRRWALLMLGAAAASAFEVSWTASTLDLSFRITAITVGLLALIWLPALVNVIALAGGGVKTPAGEASSTGLLEILRALDPGTQRQALPVVIAALGTGPEAEKATVQAAKTDLERELASLPVDASHARARLAEIADEYQEIRDSMESSPERTFRMTQLVAEARGLAASAQIDAMSLSGQWLSPKDGNRVVVLAVIQARPESSHVPIVVDAIAEAHSPFEQYQALLAAERLMRLMNDAQRASLKNAIQGRMSPDAAGVRIDRSDSSRWRRSWDLLDQL